MSVVRFDRKKIIILGFMCALVFYEASYRWGKSVDLANIEASRQQCVNQLKVAEVHNQKLEIKYNSLEKDYKAVEKSRSEEKEKYAAEISKASSQLEALKASSSKEIQAQHEIVAGLKADKDRLTKLFDKEKAKYEDELSNVRSEITRLSDSEQSWKSQLSSLHAQLQIAQDRIVSLQKELSAAKIGQTQLLNKTSHEVSNQKNTVKKPVLQKPVDKPPSKPKESEMLPKPQIIQQKLKGPESQGQDGPIEKKPGLGDFMEGKADSYKEMALKLSNGLGEGPIPPPIDNEAVIDSPDGGKMEKYLNEGRPDGDQLKKLIPNVKAEEGVKDNVEPPKVREQRRRKNEKEDADFENLNDDDNPDQYEEGAVENRADEDKGFEREGHIEEPQNDLRMNNEANEADKGDRVMILPK